jgi:hypothetical protein
MPVDFNHTIVWTHDSEASARFLAGILGLPAPNKWGPFQIVTTGNGVNVDFMDKEGKIPTQHYAFPVNEVEFDQVVGRVQEQAVDRHGIRTLLSGVIGVQMGPPGRRVHSGFNEGHGSPGLGCWL